MYWYSHHIGDFNRSTGHLSFVEKAAYHLLIERYYDTEEPLPNDVEKIKRLVGCRTPAERKAVDTILAEFFILTDSGYVNNRCEMELEKHQNRSKTAAKKSKKRWSSEAEFSLDSSVHEEQMPSSQQGQMPSYECQKSVEKQCSNFSTALLQHHSDDAVAMLTDNREPITENQEKEKAKTNPPTPREKPAGSGEFSPEFLEAWAAYPKRGGGNSRADAWRAWQARVRAGVEPAEILAGVERYARYCAHQGQIGTPYVKQAATFFGPGEHWRDEWACPARPANRAEQKVAANVETARNWASGLFVDGDFIDGEML